MSLNALATEAHELAVAKGWYDTERSFPELIALCHSELSEALEEYRQRGFDFDTYRQWSSYTTYQADGSLIDHPEEWKPEGIPIELADLIIRVCDMAGFYEIDLDAAVEAKMKYNRTRPYRHGNKLA